MYSLLCGVFDRRKQNACWKWRSDWVNDTSNLPIYDINKQKTDSRIKIATPKKSIKWIESEINVSKYCYSDTEKSSRPLFRIVITAQ